MIRRRDLLAMLPFGVGAMLGRWWGGDSPAVGAEGSDAEATVSVLVGVAWAVAPSGQAIRIMPVFGKFLSRERFLEVALAEIKRRCPVEAGWQCYGADTPEWGEAVNLLDGRPYGQWPRGFEVALKASKASLVGASLP